MLADERTLSQGVAAMRQSRLLRAAGLLVAQSAVVALLVFLTTYNLEHYPRTWFDEGSHLHVPKTLVQNGVYADRSAEGFRYYGPTAGVGPTVLLPIALVFKLAGIGLLQARLVMVVYLLAAILLFAAAVRYKYGLKVAGLATALLITSPSINLLYLGRQVLGEVPALAFLMLGLLAWWRSTAQGRYATAHLMLATLSFGLTALTKNQFTLVLMPTFVTLLALDYLYYRQLAPRFYLVPLLGTVGAATLGYLVQVLIALAGTGDAVATLRLLRDASGGAIFVFSPARMLSSLKFLMGPDVFAYWGLPALAYGLFLARQRNLGGLHQAFLVVFALVGLTWFALGSIGWPRYAFPALAVTAVLVAKLFIDMASALARTASAPTATRAPKAVAGALALLMGLALVLVHPFQNEIRLVLTSADRSPQVVANYLDTHVPRTAIIETWEPELGFLTDHRYHYPPSGWLDRAVRAKWFRADDLLVGYDPVREAHPSYLVVGPFGKYTGIYKATISSYSGWIVASIGDYDIYQIEP